MVVEEDNPVHKYFDPHSAPVLMVCLDCTSHVVEEDTVSLNSEGLVDTVVR